MTVHICDKCKRVVHAQMVITATSGKDQIMTAELCADCYRKLTNFINGRTPEKEEE